MGKYLKNHAKKNILTIIQSGLVIILIVLVMLMMVQIRNLQGTARVLNYAGLVRGAVPAKDFVGRYGGDEFIAILYQTDRRGVKNVLLALQENVDEFNDHGKGDRVSYAQGWAISSDYSHCTLQTLFDAADKYMYTNKQREKLGRQD